MLVLATGSANNHTKPSLMLHLELETAWFDLAYGVLIQTLPIGRPKLRFER